MRRPGDMSKKTAQTELDEYIFTRPEMAKLLGISTNALRMRMRKGRCELDYRYDGKQFKFKRPVQDRVITRNEDQPQTTHDKEIHDYNKKIQKKLNRGNTHKGKGKYPNDVFERHNEMKIMNHIQGKFKSDEHRKRFEKLNNKALKKIDQDIQKEREKDMGEFHGRPKYGGMIYGNSTWFDQPYDIDKAKGPNTSFHITGKPYSEIKDTPYNKEDDGSVAFDPRDLPPDDRDPEFSSKVQESIWRLKNKK